MGLDRDDGKESGNYYLGFRVEAKENTNKLEFPSILGSLDEVTMKRIFVGAGGGVHTSETQNNTVGAGAAARGGAPAVLEE